MGDGAGAFSSRDKGRMVAEYLSQLDLRFSVEIIGDGTSLGCGTASTSSSIILEDCFEGGPSGVADS